MMLLTGAPSVGNYLNGIIGRYPHGLKCLNRELFRAQTGVEVERRRLSQ